MTPDTLPADAHLYLRPFGSVASPQAYPEPSPRLAGGLVFHSQYEVIARVAGQRVGRAVMTPDELEAWIDGPQGERLATLRQRLAAPRAAWTIGERVVRFDQPQVVGILNVTPDSFSDGGAHGDGDGAVTAGMAMLEAGAALVDVGGESTRPGAAPVFEGDEIARIVPVVERLARAGAPLSVDTRKAGVMRAALAAGAGVVNDVSALRHEPDALGLVAAAGCPVVLMHAASGGADPHADGELTDPALDVFDWLEARVEVVVAAGVARTRIAVDPGMGFGKSLVENLAILNALDLYQGLGVPVMLGVSRKRLIGALAGEVEADRRLGGSVALATLALEKGVQMLRVHDVAETVQAVRVWRGLRDAALVERG